MTRRQIRSLVNHPALPEVLMIPLSKGGVALIDANDACLVSHCNWFEFRYLDQSKNGNTTYAMGSDSRTFLHRHLMGLTKADTKVFVDHINHDGLDNRRSNLRLATRSQNEANRLKSPGLTSKYKGVSWYKPGSKWTANITTNVTGPNKKIQLGLYPTEEEAAVAYQFATMRLKDNAFLLLEEIDSTRMPSNERCLEIESQVQIKIEAILSGKKGEIGASSQYRGVSWNPESSNWRAAIRIDGKNMKIGNWPTEHEAAFAYAVGAEQNPNARSGSAKFDKVDEIDAARRSQIREFVEGRLVLLMSGASARG